MMLTSGLTSPGSGHQLVLLAPAGATLPTRFRKVVDVNSRRYHSLLSGMQKMRGSIYLNDGAIQREHLESDGRHVVPSDLSSWHVLSLDPEGKVAGCSRYREHRPGVLFDELMVGQAAVTHDPVWGRMFRSAVESEIAIAHRNRVAFVEVGGWAVCDSQRFTAEALRIALSTFALARCLGGCIGITTATVRNCSSKILRKIGGASLHLQSLEIPSYFDPHYGCQMEVLRFDSRRPAPRFESWIGSIYDQLAKATVVARTQDFFPAAPLYQTSAMWSFAAASA